jgi:hypothetical protein
MHKGHEAWMNKATDVPEIPVALSMNAVTGLVPIRAPMLMEKASTQYAIVEFSKSRVTGSRRPANLAMEYSVLDLRLKNSHMYHQYSKYLPSGICEVA